VIRAVVFDFDGVLANSEPLHFRAFRDVLAETGLTLTEAAYYERYLGYDDLEAFRAIAGDANVRLGDRQLAELAVRKARHLENLEREGSVLFPGAREAILRMARHGPLAVASGALRVEIDRVLEREGLMAFFPVIVAAGDTSASKPHPAPYAKAVELMRAVTGRLIQPGECVAVEDSRWGLQSAREAGLCTVAITHSYPASELEGADAVIGHLDELTPKLLLTLSR
jgi:HAD superfamily hydrolase (TIGR01509 family)